MSSCACLQVGSSKPGSKLLITHPIASGQVIWSDPNRSGFPRDTLNFGALRVMSGKLIPARMQAALALRKTRDKK